MRFYKGFLHFLITLVSTVAFLLGWASLAHALKPAQPVKQEALVLDPLPPVGMSKNPVEPSHLQFFSQAPQPRAQSFFITRGS